MPTQRCTKNGKSGWKWGEHGHCYIGEGAEAKADRQGRAVKASQQRVLDAKKRK